MHVSGCGQSTSSQTVQRREVLPHCRYTINTDTGNTSFYKAYNVYYLNNEYLQSEQQFLNLWWNDRGSVMGRKRYRGYESLPHISTRKTTINIHQHITSSEIHVPPLNIAIHLGTCNTPSASQCTHFTWSRDKKELIWRCTHIHQIGKRNKTD